MRLRCTIAVACIFASTLGNALLVGPDFTAFFPEYSPGFHYILEEDALCGNVYKRYRELTEAGVTESGRLVNRAKEHVENDASGPPPSVLNKLSRAFELDQSNIHLADCILENTPEIIKSRMASAQVLLGLTPSLLAVLAPGAWQTGVIIAAGRRPLLALVLAAGSPTLTPSLTSGSGLMAALLRQSHGAGGDGHRFVFPLWIYKVVRDGKVGENGLVGKFFRSTGWVVFYILGVASVANVAEIIWRLITHTALAFTLSDSWFLIMWAGLGLAVHGFGALAVCLRIKRLPALNDGIDLTTSHAASYSRDPEGNSRRKPPLSTMRSGRRRNRIEVSPPGIASMILTWFTAISTVVHVAFGTLIFSSILFISVLDSVTVIMRLLASVVFCRLGMEFEIAMELRNMEVAGSPSAAVHPENGEGEQRQAPTASDQPVRLPEVELSLPK